MLRSEILLKGSVIHERLVQEYGVTPADAPKAVTMKATVRLAGTAVFCRSALSRRTEHVVDVAEHRGGRWVAHLSPLFRCSRRNLAGGTPHSLVKAL